MKLFLLVLGVLMWAAAAAALAIAKTDLDMIVAMTIGISGSVLVAGGCIVVAIEEAARSKSDESAKH